tara:strand:+ start:594 stop:881 length:288 start_codon:yes stop_codon:yes gene_type:complete
MKDLILRWLGLDQTVATDEQVEKVVERVVERLLAQNYDFDGFTSRVEDLEGLVEDIERYVEDHSVGLETLEERVDDIYSPDGFELTLTAKTQEVA